MKIKIKRHKSTLFYFTVTTLIGAAAIYFGSDHGQAQRGPRYKDPHLSIDERVKDLLSRMTIEEKAAQMMCLWDQKPNVQTGVPTGQKAPRGEFSPELAKQRLAFGIGQIARQGEERDPKASAEYTNALQKWLIENTRLGIPAIFHDEILH